MVCRDRRPESPEPDSRVPVCAEQLAMAWDDVRVDTSRSELEHRPRRILVGDCQSRWLTAASPERDPHRRPGAPPPELSRSLRTRKTDESPLRVDLGFDQPYAGRLDGR